jgi:hypothetical protein
LVLKQPLGKNGQARFFPYIQCPSKTEKSLGQNKISGKTKFRTVTGFADKRYPGPLFQNLRFWKSLTGFDFLGILE